MVPSSTVHFSLPTSTQLVRSLPLKRRTHCSPGYSGRLVGTCAAIVTGMVSTHSTLIAIHDLGTGRPMSSSWRIQPLGIIPRAVGCAHGGDPRHPLGHE